jgi:hypothetical protein
MDYRISENNCDKKISLFIFKKLWDFLTKNKKGRFLLFSVESYQDFLETNTCAIKLAVLNK